MGNLLIFAVGVGCVIVGFTDGVTVIFGGCVGVAVEAVIVVEGIALGPDIIGVGVGVVEGVFCVLLAEIHAVRRRTIPTTAIPIAARFLSGLFRKEVSFISFVFLSILGRRPLLVAILVEGRSETDTTM